MKFQRLQAVKQTHQSDSPQNIFRSKMPKCLTRKLLISNVRTFFEMKLGKTWREKQESFVDRSAAHEETRLLLRLPTTANDPPTDTASTLQARESPTSGNDSDKIQMLQRNTCEGENEREASISLERLHACCAPRIGCTYSNWLQSVRDKSER